MFSLFMIINRAKVRQYFEVEIKKRVFFSKKS